MLDSLARTKFIISRLGSNQKYPESLAIFYLDLVDLSALGDGPLTPGMKPPDGIGGLDPRKHASVEVGRRNVELAVQVIGRKVRELLERLPTSQNASRPRAITPGQWWMI